MKRIFQQKNFPFLVLVVYLSKSFHTPLSFMDLSVVGIFATLFFSNFYFKYKETLDTNEKIKSQIKELEETYEKKANELHEVIMKLETEYQKRVQNFESRIQGIDVFYNKKQAQNNLRDEFKWGGNG